MIFLDNASTTKINKSVIEEINRVNSELFYNPSSLYYKSIEINTQINSIKLEFLKLLKANSFDSFIFTGSATESNNLAIRGVLKKNGKLLISSGEHPSVHSLAKQLQQEGFEVDFIKLDKNGLIDENDLQTKLINTTVVSLIHVSNETGAINNISKLTEKIKQYNKNIIVHCDGVQAFGKIDVNLNSLNVDLYSVSAHKIHGPKGIGGLYVKKGINLKPLMFGGDQENGLRPGTYNTSNIFGFIVAARNAVSNLSNNYKKIEILNNKLRELLSKNIPEIEILSNKETSSPYILTIYVPKINAETTLHLLEEFNIFIANGSACSSRNPENRVLIEMGYSKEIAKSSVRISFSSENTTEEILFLVEKLKIIIEKQHRIIK